MTSNNNGGGAVTLHLCAARAGQALTVPYGGRIRAGFPSPAQDYITEAIDLNRLVVHDPDTTFFARVDGDSMRDAGIADGDLVVIDKSLEAREGDIVAAFIDGEFTLKRFHVDEQGHCAWLMPANPAYRPLRVTADSDFVVWGVMTHSIRRYRNTGN